MMGAAAHEPSAGLMKFADCLAGKLVLDAPCGFGRNSFALAGMGCTVVAVDRDMKRLGVLEKESARREFANRISPVCANLGTDSWCFPPASFDAAICVHFDFRPILGPLLATIRAGGHVYIESFGGHGRNYLALPTADELRRTLTRGFHIKLYTERKVGPNTIDAVAVTTFAQKRPN